MTYATILGWVKGVTVRAATWLIKRKIKRNRWITGGFIGSILPIMIYRSVIPGALPAPATVTCPLPLIPAVPPIPTIYLEVYGGKTIQKLHFKTKRIILGVLFAIPEQYLWLAGMVWLYRSGAFFVTINSLLALCSMPTLPNII